MRKLSLVLLLILPFLVPAQNVRFHVVCNNPILNESLDLAISPGDSLLRYYLYVNDQFIDSSQYDIYGDDPYQLSFPVSMFKLSPWTDTCTMTLKLTGIDTVTEEQKIPIEYRSLFRQAHKDALLIANNTYRNRPWKSLSAPIEETARIEKLLREQFGFQTKMITNASRTDIINALYELSTQSNSYDNPYDQLLVWYSGHGQYDSVFNTGYIVPTDGTARTESYISYLDLGQILNNIHYNHVLFISDACFSGTFFLHNADLGDALDEVRNQSLMGAGKREALSRKSRLAITSTSPSTESPAKSQLAASLISTLSNPFDNFIDFTELKSALTSSSEDNSSENAIHCKGFGNNSIQGTFVFLRSRAWLNEVSRHDGDSCGTVKDYDGNVYTTTRIGRQCWLREDIRSRHYSDGTPIPLTDYHILPKPVPKDSIPALKATLNDSLFPPMMFLVPNHDQPGSPEVVMYNWPAACRTSPDGDTNLCEKLQGVCPDGWHVPSDCDWDELQTHLQTSIKEYYTGDERVDDPHRYIAKSLADTLQWRSSTNKYAVGKSIKKNNKSRMSMLPAGAIGWKYGVSNNYADFWSSTRKNPFGEDICRFVCGYFYLSTDDREVWTGTAEHFVGMCVRCVKDDASAKNTSASVK